MPETEMVQLERKQRMSGMMSELTSRFENIETYKIDYSLAGKMETNYRIWQYRCMFQVRNYK